MISAQFKKPFAEQLDFFRRKLNIPVADWRDLPGRFNDAGFFVTGALKADLVADLRADIDRVIAEGKSLQWFRENFNALVEKHGWASVSEKFGDPAYRDWRSRVIYQTNLSTSYHAGRYTQLTNPELLAVAPYWMYRHSDAVAHPRPWHLAWNRITKLSTDPWFQTHYTPNGWGCQCYIVAVSKAEAIRMGGKFGSAPGEGETYKVIDSKTGEVLNVPVGIDRGWDYAPGATAAQMAARAATDKALKWDPEIASEYLKLLRDSPAFAEFFARAKFAADNTDRWPLAMLPSADAGSLAVERGVVILSRTSLNEHLIAHPEIGVADYRRVQAILNTGEVYRDGDGRLSYLFPASDTQDYFAAVKRDADRPNLFFVTLFRMNRARGAARIRKSRERIR